MKKIDRENWLKEIATAKRSQDQLMPAVEISTRRIAGVKRGNVEVPQTTR